MLKRGRGEVHLQIKDIRELLLNEYPHRINL